MSSSALPSSGCGWVDRKLRELRGAREFLAGIGMAPQRDDASLQHRYAGPTKWRLPYLPASFDDAELLELARERGFDPVSVHG